MNIEDIPQIWRQRDDEPANAFEAFHSFLELGVGRTVRDTYRQVKGNPEAREPSSTWRTWSTRFEWFKRADAFDRYHAALDRAADERAFAEERRTWAQRRALIRREAWDDAEKLRAKARDMLLMPLTEQKTTNVVKSEDGKTVHQHITIMPAKFSMQDAATYLALADKLARLAADMETERIMHDTLEAKKARELEDARAAFRESATLYPDESPLARAEALSVAYGFSVEAIMAGSEPMDAPPAPDLSN